jgi:hypothetical protein
MPVISLSKQDVGSEPHLPSILRAQDTLPRSSTAPEPVKDGSKGEQSLHVSNGSIDSGIAFHALRSGPTPISPVPESPAEFGSESAGASSSRPIPPPPTPRRHKSGILLSRVRAHTSGSGTTFKSSSRSFGDLSDSVLGMSCVGDPEDAGPSTSASVGTSPNKRIVSEGARKRPDDSDDDGDMWDNS